MRLCRAIIGLTFFTANLTRPEAGGCAKGLI